MRCSIGCNGMIHPSDPVLIPSFFDCPRRMFVMDCFRPEVATQLLCETRAAKSTVELKKTVHSETGVSLGKLG